MKVKEGKCTHDMCIEWNRVKPIKGEEDLPDNSPEEQKMKGVPWTCLMNLVY